MLGLDGFEFLVFNFRNNIVFTTNIYTLIFDIDLIFEKS